MVGVIADGVLHTPEIQYENVKLAVSFDYPRLFKTSRTDSKSSEVFEEVECEVECKSQGSLLGLHPSSA